MDIEESTVNNYSQLDILVHCLHEMTFNGYSEEEIIKRKNDLEERIKSLNDSSNKTLTLEELTQASQENI